MPYQYKNPEAERRLDEEARRNYQFVHCADCNRVVYMVNAFACEDGRLRCVDCTEDYAQMRHEQRKVKP